MSQDLRSRSTGREPRLPPHARIASVSAADRTAAANLVAAADAELVEVRLDALWPSPPEEEAATEDLVTILEAAGEARLLATLRPKRQAGAYEGPEDVRISLLLAAVQAGFHAVDIENDHREVPKLLPSFREAGSVIVLSDHRFHEAPSREQGLRHLLSMQDQQADLHKLAFPCGSFMDMLRCLELCHAHAHRGGRPAIAPLGAGVMARALLPLAGDRATYGHAGKEAVPGQPPLADIEAVWHHWGITPDDLPGDPEAGWLAVLGDPVAHSLSPRIHNAALRHAGRKERYGALRVPESLGAVRLLATVAGRIGLRGASVTAPLKTLVAQVAAGDDAVQATGAANCVRTTATGLEATNTDATAFRRLFHAHRDATHHVAVLGNGGAARAAVWAARQEGIDATVVARDAEAGSALAKQMDAAYAPWDERASLRPDTWVQATPIGSADDASPLPSDVLRGSEALVELVYAAGATSLEKLAAEQGLAVVSGRQFLVEQALDAFRFWTGQEAHRAAMEASL